MAAAVVLCNGVHCMADTVAVVVVLLLTKIMFHNSEMQIEHL
jgi:hypothetical protein